MPITQVILENFKGVAERVAIPLRPITLLFGANSAGKSTILQGMLYLRELLEHRNADADRLHNCGETIDLGGFLKLVHGHDPKRLVRVGVTVTVDDDGLNTYGRAPYDDDEDYVSSWDRQLPLAGIHEVTVMLTVQWDATERRAHFQTYEVEVNGCPIGKIHEPLWDHPEDRQRMATLSINEDHLIFKQVFGNREEDEISRSLRRDHRDDPIAGQLGFVNAISYPTRMVLPNIAQGQPLRLWEAATSGSTELSTQDAEELFSHIMVGAGQRVLEELQSIRYIGPIRVVPDHFFRPVLSPMESRWADGSAAWDMLHKGEDDLAWFRPEHLAMLELGYSVEMHEFYEVDRRGALGRALWDSSRPASSGLKNQSLDSSQVKAGLRERRRLRITSNETGLEVAPTEIGVGVSQLLPVVVGAMAPTYHLLAVEQPELHVHPAVQCRLADVLALQVVGKERILLLETHSEHLMLRLLRRVREAAANENDDERLQLKPEDLSVLYISSQTGGMEVLHLPVNKDGDFDKPWPKGFFEERAEELF